MTYLLAENVNSEPAGERFRRLAEAEPILQLPGAYNGLSALQAMHAGFESLYLSGAAMSAAMGLPDLGILTIEDVCFHIRQIVRVSQLPVLVDGDTGFGEALNVMQMVRAFEEAGAGAVQIEDQLLPKKCGHLNDKKLASAQDMAAKIAAARKARRNLYIVARTDALEQEGLDGAVARARLYVEAGADAIFPEALNDSNAFAKFSSEVEVPLLANMTEFGRTPFMTAEQFQALGFAMVIWPVSALRVAARAHEELYATIREHGWTRPMLERMQTRAELYETIGYHQYEELDGTIARSLIPGGNPEN